METHIEPQAVQGDVEPQLVRRPPPDHLSHIRSGNPGGLLRNGEHQVKQCRIEEDAERLIAFRLINEMPQDLWHPKLHADPRKNEQRQKPHAGGLGREVLPKERPVLSNRDFHESTASDRISKSARWCEAKVRKDLTPGRETRLK